jgi:hypothetical protein
MRRRLGEDGCGGGKGVLKFGAGGGRRSSSVSAPGRERRVWPGEGEGGGAEKSTSMSMISGGSSISRSGRDANDRREGEDGWDSLSLRSMSRSGRLSRDIDGELGGGIYDGDINGDDRKDGGDVLGEGAISYGEGKNMDDGGGADFSLSTSIE